MLEPADSNTAEGMSMLMPVGSDEVVAIRPPVDVQETVIGFADVEKLQFDEEPDGKTKPPRSNKVSASFMQERPPAKPTLALFHTVRENVRESPA